MTAVTELVVEVEIEQGVTDLTLTVWWDPNDESIEAAALRPWDASDGEESLPLALLWLMIDRDDLLELLFAAWQSGLDEVDDGRLQ
jgi:hypothetical protein